jgi:hypothetical protein
MPTAGYLEGPGGPIPVRDIEWVDVSTILLEGGLAGRPLQMINSKDELLAGLRRTQLDWYLCESTWSVSKVFDDQPVQVVRVVSPFRQSADDRFPEAL